MQSQRTPVQSLETSLIHSESNVKPVLAKPTYSGAVYSSSDISDILTLAYSMQERIVVNQAILNLGDRLSASGIATDAESFDPNKISEEALYSTANDLRIESDYVKQATEILRPTLKKIQYDVARFGSNLSKDVKKIHLRQDLDECLRNTFSSLINVNYVLKRNDENGIDTSNNSPPYWLYKIDETKKIKKVSFFRKLINDAKGLPQKNHVTVTEKKYTKIAKIFHQVVMYGDDGDNSGFLAVDLDVYTPEALALLGEPLRKLAGSLRITHHYRTDRI